MVVAILYYYLCMYVLKVGQFGCLVAVLVWLVAWSVGLAALAGMDGAGIGMGMGFGMCIGSGFGICIGVGIGACIGIGTGISTIGTGIVYALALAGAFAFALVVALAPTNPPSNQTNQPTSTSS